MKDPAIETRRASPAAADIVLQNPNRYPEASARRLRPWLERLVADLAARELPDAAGALSLGVRFAGDRELRRVNRDFRGKDKPTDVLSFPGDGEDGPDGTHVGGPWFRHCSPSAVTARHPRIRRNPGTSAAESTI